MNEILNGLMGYDLEALIQSVGLVGIFLIVFAESGLLIGFFLPGDSLLFTAGLLASPAFDILDLWPLIMFAWIAAVLGDNVGYEFGKRVGRNLYEKKDSKFFKKEHLRKAEKFYEKHGPKAIVLSRYLPFIRTFAPIVAGMAKMDHKKFTLYNFLGGTVWVWSIILLGYYLGTVIPNVDVYILPTVLIIISISIIPGIIHFVRENRRNKKNEADLTPDPVVLP